MINFTPFGIFKLFFIQQIYSSVTPDFLGVRVARSLVFCVMFCRSLFVLFPLAILLSVLLRFMAYQTFLHPYHFLSEIHIYICKPIRLLDTFLRYYSLATFL